jgi:hypothetical protein
MNHPIIQNEPPPPVLGPDDPPIDFSREMKAYQKEEERLVRDHLGKIALVHGDEVVGAFDTADEAFLEGFRRFGYVRLMLKEIRDPNAPLDFVSLVDPHHPSSTPVTSVLSAIEQGDPHAADQLLPLVYDELRRLAAQKLAQEKPGQASFFLSLISSEFLQHPNRLTTV